MRQSYTFAASLLFAAAVGLSSPSAWAHDHDAGIADGSRGDPSQNDTAPNTGGVASADQRGGGRGETASGLGMGNTGGAGNSDGGIGQDHDDPPGQSLK